MEIFKGKLHLSMESISPSSNRNVVNTLYPATGEILCELLEKQILDDIAFAVESAEKGFKVWSK